MHQRDLRIRRKFMGVVVVILYVVVSYIKPTVQLHEDVCGVWEYRHHRRAIRTTVSGKEEPHQSNRPATIPSRCTSASTPWDGASARGRVGAPAIGPAASGCSSWKTAVVIGWEGRGGTNRR